MVEEKIPIFSQVSSNISTFFPGFILDQNSEAITVIIAPQQVSSFIPNVLPDSLLSKWRSFAFLKELSELNLEPFLNIVLFESKHSVDEILFTYALDHNMTCSKYSMLEYMNITALE